MRVQGRFCGVLGKVLGKFWKLIPACTIGCVFGRCGFGVVFGVIFGLIFKIAL